MLVVHSFVSFRLVCPASRRKIKRRSVVRKHINSESVRLASDDDYDDEYQVRSCLKLASREHEGELQFVATRARAQIHVSKQTQIANAHEDELSL